LSEFINIDIPEISKYPLFIPRNFALKIKNSKAMQLEFLPSNLEENATGLLDPIGDEAYSQGGQLIHRYKNRLLFAPTTKCPINCRYCFRKNELFENDEMFKADFDKTLSYLK